MLNVIKVEIGVLHLSKITNVVLKSIELYAYFKNAR